MRNPFRMFRPAPASVTVAGTASTPKTPSASTEAGDGLMEGLLRASGCSYDDADLALAKAKALRASRATEAKEARDRVRMQEGLSRNAAWDETSARAACAVLARRTSAAEARARDSEAATARLARASLAHGLRRDAARLRAKETGDAVDARLSACLGLLDALREAAPDHPLLLPYAVGYADGSTRTGVDAVSDEAADLVCEQYGLPLFRDTLATGTAAA